MTDENGASQEPILIMGFEPDPERTPEDVRQWYSQDRSEAGLAKAFAAASNKFWWVEDNIYDYPEGTPEHQEACRITDAWGAVMDELEHEIFAILRREGVEIPKTGRIGVLVPFMERNGYCDRGGWWVPKKPGKPDSPA